LRRIRRHERETDAEKFFKDSSKRVRISVPGQFFAEQERNFSRVTNITTAEQMRETV
jgi:hypothetical protein